MQFECINCGLCVDACNAVMDKMEYDRGLISFTSQDAIDNGVTHVFRPRLLGYALAVVVMIGAFSYVLATRTGRTAMVDNLTELWAAAEDLAGNACDPLDETLLARLRT